MLEAMRAVNIPEWYIKSCEKVQYLFPKAHAVAYVLMAYRIAYCKVHYPKEFYAAYFTVRAKDFDYTHVSKGKSYVKILLRMFTNRDLRLRRWIKQLLLIWSLSMRCWSAVLALIKWIYTSRTRLNSWLRKTACARPWLLWAV